MKLNVSYNKDISMWAVDSIKYCCHKMDARYHKDLIFFDNQSLKLVAYINNEEIDYLESFDYCPYCGSKIEILK